MSDARWEKSAQVQARESRPAGGVRVIDLVHGWVTVIVVVLHGGVWILEMAARMFPAVETGCCSVRSRGRRYGFLREQVGGFQTFHLLDVPPQSESRAAALSGLPRTRQVLGTRERPVLGTFGRGVWIPCAFELKRCTWE